MPSAAPIPSISLLWSTPFLLLLICTAVLPLLRKQFWEHYYWAVALGLGAVAAGYYLLLAPSRSPWVHAMLEYVSFIVLLGSLYIVSGGIFIRVSRKATPLANCVLLLIGGVLANVFGTTGASMLLIRPYLRMNRGHVKPFHVVFFIFMVANVGGALTPIGDPPLFLGYLAGVPFWWVLEHCRPMWVMTVAMLISVFFVIDTIDHRRYERAHPNETAHDHPSAGRGSGVVYVRGIHNFLFIGLILFAVFQEGVVDMIERAHEQSGFTAATLGRLLISREVLMIAAALLSRAFTHAELYEWNEFAYHAIREVAILFIGIFSTMAPALQWLDQNAATQPVRTPGQYYFTSGALSSVLDNAPTYLTFLHMELSQVDDAKVDRAAEELKRMGEANTVQVRRDLDPEIREALEAMVYYHRSDVLSGKVNRDELRVAFLISVPHLNRLIVAISLGAVFFGACTYIGNGPNFMVKSIADASGATTPSFFTYIVKYVLPVLLPIYVLVWLVFLHRW